MILKIISLLIKYNYITEDEKEEYCYGMEIIILKFIHFFIIVGIGILLSDFIEIIVFICLYSRLRGLLGGFHASSRYCCMLISVCISLFVCMFINIINIHTNLLVLATLILALIFIFLNSLSKNSCIYVLITVFALLPLIKFNYIEFTKVVFLSYLITIGLYFTKTSIMKV